MNLILGILVDVAQQNRASLLAEINKEKTMKQMETKSHLLSMCQSMDLDCSGELSIRELEEGYEAVSEFRDTLTALDIQKEDLQIVWLLMDSDRSGKVDYMEFVAQLYNMRANDTHYMLAYIKYYITVVRDRLLEEIAAVSHNYQIEMRALSVIQNELRELLTLSHSADPVHKRGAGTNVDGGSDDDPTQVPASKTEYVIEEMRQHHFELMASMDSLFRLLRPPILDVAQPAVGAVSCDTNRSSWSFCQKIDAGEKESVPAPAGFNMWASPQISGKYRSDPASSQVCPRRVPGTVA